MALRDILIHMDGAPPCEARLDLAVALARRHGARLTGLYVVTHAPYASRGAAGEGRAREAEALFRDQTAAAGLESEWRLAEWQVVGVKASEVVTLHAYYADLVVVGQPAAGGGRAGSAGPLPERLVLGAGRPVLVVPCAGRFDGAGARVLVAWNAGREATRALNDALPLLRAAEEVAVVTVTGGEKGGAPAGDICGHLARHGVPVRSETLTAAELPVGDALLNRVAEGGFDLLVTGAYGRSPRGAPALGAVARHLLRSMTVPVLMAH